MRSLYKKVRSEVLETHRKSNKRGDAYLAPDSTLPEKGYTDTTPGSLLTQQDFKQACHFTLQHQG